jgi:hypothetical protein
VALVNVSPGEALPGFTDWVETHVARTLLVSRRESLVIATRNSCR